MSVFPATFSGKLPARCLCHGAGHRRCARARNDSISPPRALLLVAQARTLLLVIKGESAVFMLLIDVPAALCI